MIRLLLVFILIFVMPLTVIGQDECDIRPFSEANIGSEAGHLVYSDNETQEIMGLVDNSFKYQKPGYTHLLPARIFENDTRLLWVTNEANTEDDWASVVLHSYQTEIDNYQSIVLIGNSDWGPHQLHWMGSNSVLLIYSHEGLLPPDTTVYPFSIINLQTLEITYVYPYFADFARYMEELGHPTNEILGEYLYPYWFNFSPDGQYLLISDLLVDASTFEKIELDNLSGSIWSHDSKKLLGVYWFENTYEFTIYNVTDDIVATIATIELPENYWLSYGYFGSEQGKWSPDEHFLSVSIHKPDDTETFAVIDLQSKQLYETCMLGYGKNWSLDSRYLAMYGSLEPDSTPNTIFVYDVINDIFYEVVKGDTTIIGWLNLLP